MVIFDDSATVVLCRRPVPWGWTIANALVLDKVKERIGFNESKLLLVGAAPIHRDVLEHFMKYNIPVLELYGMSEDTGPAALNTLANWRLGSVGKPLVGTKIKLDNVDENEEGEVRQCVHVVNVDRLLVLCWFLLSDQSAFEVTSSTTKLIGQNTRLDNFQFTIHCAHPPHQDCNQNYIIQHHFTESL